MYGKEETKMVGDVWIYRDGNKILILGAKKMIENTELTEAEIEEFNKEDVVTKEKYQERVQELKKMKEETPAIYEVSMKGAVEFGLFSAGEDIEETKDFDESYTNVQAIVFTVVHGVVTVALLTFATLAVVITLKKKKA